MLASAGDFVSPGTPIMIPEGVEVGDGLHEGDNGVIASFSGTLEINDGILNLVTNRPQINIPNIGDVFIGQVNRLNPKTAEIKILHIEDTDSGHRDVPALSQFADIYITELVDRFIPSTGDTMRVRDIIRAKIIDNDPILKASTKGDKNLGVLHALCPACGLDLQINDKKVDFNVACTRCDYSGYRVLSSDFGNGFSSKNGDTISSLNREGERWSSAADSMLGHDGARPYLSPVADFRRGISHTKPEITKKKRDNFSNNRPQRTMHPTNCTLCDVKTEVPFVPTPGKPIRCRDCMSKVKEGKASKDELSKEREILMKARSKASEEAGIKLFVARLDYEVTEDDLTKVFSPFGQIKDLHIASDRETGKSKGFAFVTFQNIKDGKKAISQLNNKELNGRKISIQESRQDSSRNRKNRNRK